MYVKLRYEVLVSKLSEEKGELVFFDHFRGLNGLKSKSGRKKKVRCSLMSLNVSQCRIYFSIELKMYFKLTG